MPPDDFIHEYQQRVNQQLHAYLPGAQTPPTDLHQAMRYAVLGGGKRLRALLVYATGGALGVAPAVLDPAAAAVEMVHAFSLIHDDLPAMDDDDWRRGKPACHKAFGEATAILAGDALQSLAFATLVQPSTELTAEQQLAMLTVLARAVGSQGMAGGQAMDLAAERQAVSAEQLAAIHQHKTGALIAASVELGLLASHTASATQRQYLQQFAAHLGLAFQIHDDILDVEGNLETLGKMPGADAAHQKATYPALMGLTAAKTHAAELYQQAINQLQQAQLTLSYLPTLARWMIGRDS